MTDIDARIRLTSVHCIDEGDGPGSAEPYLWTVFFKVDGTTTSITPQLRLTGRATVVGTPGNHGDLPSHDVDDGEVITIPTVLGAYRTRLRPIPLQQSVGSIRDIGGVLGVVLVLMEEDNTPNSAIAAGHRALDRAVRRALDALIPTLNVGHPEPTPQEIAALTGRVGKAVESAVRADLTVWDWVGGLGNQDDRIGSAVELFGHQALLQAGAPGIGFSRHFDSAGEWRIGGRAFGRPLVSVLDGPIDAAAAPRSS